jgi:hypothetical protein
MESRARWISEGPDTFELEAVLASGLHDGIHEDDLEEMAFRGQAVSTAAAVLPPKKSRPTARVAETEPRALAASAAATTADWFKAHYPKLQPADLADYYREKYLKIHVPVRTGTSDGFKQFREMLGQHVRNSNVLDDAQTKPVVTEPVKPVQKVEDADEFALPPQLEITSEMFMQRPLPVMQHPVAPRMFSVVMLTLGALVIGGLIGLGLANPSGLTGLLAADGSGAQIKAWIPASLW